MNRTFYYMEMLQRSSCSLAGKKNIHRAFHNVLRQSQKNEHGLKSDFHQASVDKNRDRIDFKRADSFSKKTIWELIRAYFVLKVTSYEFIVIHSEKIFLFGHRYLWRTLFDMIMNISFYGHFASGKTLEEAKHTVEKLREAGIRTMLFIPMESPLYELTEPQKFYEENKERMKICAEGTAYLESNGFSQLKITPLADKKLFKRMNEYLIDHETNHEENECWNFGRVAELVKEKRFEDIHVSDLSDEENRELRRLLRRLNEICELGRDLNVRIMFDAEQTYLQSSLGYLVLLFQVIYNKKEVVVFNTYQCYRKDTLRRIKADYLLGEELGFQIAGKFVRGAYMFEERRLANEDNYEDPINETYESTNDMYHSCIDFMLPIAAAGKSSIMVATHNEDTVTYVTERMNDLSIDKKDPNVCFGQIYGMCDHVSYTLGMLDYQIFKSVPCGTIDDTLLYLTRRAHENRSVLARTKLERSLIGTEIGNRILGK